MASNQYDSTRASTKGTCSHIIESPVVTVVQGAAATLNDLSGRQWGMQWWPAAALQGG